MLHHSMTMWAIILSTTDVNAKYTYEEHKCTYINADNISTIDIYIIFNILTTWAWLTHLNNVTDINADHVSIIDI